MKSLKITVPNLKNHEEQPYVFKMESKLDTQETDKYSFHAGTTTFFKSKAHEFIRHTF